jgi:hypothetical protein
MRHQSPPTPPLSLLLSETEFCTYAYVVCSKSIEPLVGRNTFIDLEVQNPNPLQSSLLGNAHTSPSASAIVGNSSGTCLMEW